MSLPPSVQEPLSVAPASTEGVSSAPSSRSLSRTIGLGFTGVLLLHLAVAVLSHVGLSSATEREQQVNREQAILSAALRNDRDVAELQRDALSFMYTGTPMTAVQVDEDAQVLADKLQRFAETVDGQSYLDLSTKMLEGLKNYRDGFQKVVTDRDLRDQLLETSVRPYSRQMRDRLALLMSEDRSIEDNQHALLAADALREFTECGGSIDRYIASPNSKHARRFEECYRRFKAILAALGEDTGPVNTELSQWRSDVLEVVNRTRSFLHLVNVVLSGEALEFRALSGSLTSMMLEERQRVADESLAAQTRFTRASAAFGILTVVGGILAGLWIGRSVASPIVAITDTFSRLARGEDAPITGLERSDEIGEMARSAKVFALRNQETRMLLARATELSEAQSVTNASLLEHVRELQQRNEDLDSFCFSASHDLRSPLRSISLLSQWIEEDDGNELSQDSSEFLQTLKSRSLRLQNLLDGLLEYSRAERAEELSERFDALAMTEQVVELASQASPAKFEVTGDSSPMFTSRLAIETCVRNLIENSIKHSDREVPFIRVEVRNDDGGYTTVTVHDDGPGIPPALHTKVLQIFETVRRRDEQDASGIGLAIVQRLAEKHGASLRIVSDGLRGCSISFRWPSGDLSVPPTLRFCESEFPASLAAASTHRHPDTPTEPETPLVRPSLREASSSTSAS